MELQFLSHLLYLNLSCPVAVSLSVCISASSTLSVYLFQCNPPPLPVWFAELKKFPLEMFKNHRMDCTHAHTHASHTYEVQWIHRAFRFSTQSRWLISIIKSKLIILMCRIDTPWHSYCSRRHTQSCVCVCLSGMHFDTKPKQTSRLQ